MTDLDRRKFVGGSAASLAATACAGIGEGAEASALPPAHPLLADLGVRAPVRTAMSQGRPIAITRRGRGRPVVCLHAIAHGGRDFEGLADRLQDTCEIIAIDFPGHGLTPDDGAPVRIAHYGEVVGGVLDTLNLVNPILLGNSIGGGAALHFALRNPGRVSGLVLCDSAGFIPPSPLSAPVIKQMIGMFQMGAANDPGFSTAYAQYYAGTVLPAEAARSQRERIIAAGYRMAPKLVDAWTGFLEPEAYLGAGFPGLTIPAWLAWAKNDRLVSWEFCKHAAAALPDHSVTLFEGGHSPFLEDPDAFASGLKQFLATLA